MYNIIKSALIKEFKVAVFQKDELEYQIMSTSIARLTVFANHDSTSNVENETFDFLKTNSPPQVKKLSGMTPCYKNETGRMKKEEFEYRNMSRLIAFSGNSGPSRFH